MADPYTPERRDIASRFNEAAYNEPPSNFDAARQLGNSTTRVTGIALQKGGRSMERRGSKLIRAGAAMSRSGAGAIVGAPLMAAGAALRGAGQINSATGKALDRQAQGTKKLLRARGVASAKDDIKKRVAATRINLMVLSIATPIWFTLQLPIALAALFALAVAGVGETLATTILGNGFIGFLYSAYDGFANYVESFSGININIFESITGLNQVLFGALTTLVFFLGMFIMGLMAALYIFSGIRCFFGTHSLFKIATFIFALLGYLMPGLNIFPWFILWGAVVWRYPK